MDHSGHIPAAELAALDERLPHGAQDYVDRRAHFDRIFPTVPVDAPGMPPPGPDVDRHARMHLPAAYIPAPVKGLKGVEKQAVLAENQRLGAAFREQYDDVVQYLYLRYLYRPQCDFWVAARGPCTATRLLAGTFRATAAGRIPGWGPRRARVMVVGKNPGGLEVDCGENFIGRASEPLVRALAELDLTDAVGSWYWTNAVKHPQLDPNRKDIPEAQLKNMRPLLAQELRLVRPDYVLCLGDDATKMVLGRRASTASLFGRVVDLPIALQVAADAPPVAHLARAMAICHPAKVAHRPAAYGDLVAGLSGFHALITGRRTGDAETGLRHVCLYTERQLAAVVDQVLRDTPRGAAIAVDCEWHGDRPGAPGAYLRTIQFGHRPKHGYCVVLRHQGGVPAFRPGPAAARHHLLRLLKSTADRPVRVGGHYLTADLPWLLDYGVDVRAEYTAAETPEATRTRGGWDTYRLVHAYQEEIEGGYKLENLAARFCGMPRYDVELQAWKDAYCAAHRLRDKDLGGYGECPDEVLHPYAIYDVDSTIRLFDRFNGRWDGAHADPGLLDRGRHGEDSRPAAWLDQLAVPAILEMESTGLALDRDRGDRLTDVFITAHDTLLAAFRARINWGPRTEGEKLVDAGFNPGSDQQRRELLFGVDLNGALDTQTNTCRRRSPPGARLLGLTPLMSSGDKPEPWERVGDRAGAAGGVWPSTAKETLGILTHTPGEVGRLVGMLRDLRFMAKVLTGVLRRPWRDAAGVVATAVDFDLEQDGDYATGAATDGAPRIYDGGLMSFEGHDGRVRTHFGLVETGRWSSWSPNLHNVSKRREDDYKRILGIREFDKAEGAWKAKGDYLAELDGPRYLYPIRSLLTAADGCVLIEADYKMAEMAMIGWLAQDPTMMDHVRRNGLKKSDPDFLDPHAAMAIHAFHLDTPGNRAIVAAKGGTWGPTKSVLELLDRVALRTAAKNVIYGVPYGRSAEAIARQCREEGAKVTVDEAQALIDTYKQENYPEIAEFLDRCAARVLDPGWMCGTFERYRRFPQTDDETIVGELQRQACNYPIQNGVAECVDHACHELWKERAARGVPGSRDRWFRFCLQIHDALLFEVPIPAVPWFVDSVVVECMSARVPIRPRDLDGRLLPGVGPYHLGVDVEVYRHWGEEIDRVWALEAGLPELTPGGHRLLPPAGAAPPPPVPARPALLPGPRGRIR